MTRFWSLAPLLVPLFVGVGVTGVALVCRGLVLRRLIAAARRRNTESAELLYRSVRLPSLLWSVAAGLSGVLAGCGGTSSSSGASEVSLTREGRESIGSLCAIEGHATNVGNLRVNVTIQYEARNASGAVIGSSTAFFQIAPFSDFDFGPRKPNHLGQPSSGTFTNGLSCAAIESFKRVNVDVTRA